MKALYVSEYVERISQLTPSWIAEPIFPPSQARIPKHLKGQSLVLVKVRYTSPTHVDTLYARGLHQNNHAKLVHPPFVLGTEFAGVVAQIHAPTSSPLILNGTPLRVGDEVWGASLGSFAPLVICTASSIYRIPAGLSLYSAAGLGASTAPVSYGALVNLAGLRKGETCLIHAAAGGLGVAAVMVAKAVGAKVIGTVGSETKASVVRKILDRQQGDTSGNGVVLYDRDGWEKEVLALTNSQGVDVVFDTVGLVAKSIRCCKFGGRIVIVGFVGRGDGKNGTMENVAMNRILLKGVKVMGYRYGETSRQQPEKMKRLWTGFEELLGTGRIQPVIHRHYKGLDKVPEALEEQASRSVCGKIVIEVDDVQDLFNKPKASVPML